MRLGARWGGVGWEVACGDCAVSSWPGKTRGALASGGTNDNDRCINLEAVCVCVCVVCVWMGGWAGGVGGGIYSLVFVDRDVMPVVTTDLLAFIEWES